MEQAKKNTGSLHAVKAAVGMIACFALAVFLVYTGFQTFSWCLAREAISIKLLGIPGIIIFIGAGFVIFRTGYGMLAPRVKAALLKGIVYAAGIVTVAALLVIVGYMAIKGVGHVNIPFLKTILPYFYNTVFMILISLLIATPLGIFTAVYLNEYAKPGKIVNSIRFAVDCLAGIPSIVFGLFGMMFFGRFLNLGYSMLSGGLTLAIMVLPIMIRTVEEALKSVPMAYREASLALGATKLRTILKTVMPSCLDGIMTGIILAVGRIVGETAALIYTAGTVAALAFSAVPGEALGFLNSGRTLAIHMYLIAKEAVNLDEAYATALVLIVLTLLINFAANRVSGHREAKQRKMEKAAKH